MDLDTLERLSKLESEYLFNIYMYNEGGAYFLVQVIEDSSDDEYEKYSLRILKDLNNNKKVRKSKKNTFSVSKAREGGHMCGWYLRKPSECTHLPIDLSL